MAEQTGTIKEIYPEEKISESLSKRRFIIEEDGKYKNTICFELINGRTDLIDPYQIGDNVKVSYNIKSHCHSDKWYTQAIAWKLERI